MFNILRIFRRKIIPVNLPKLESKTLEFPDIQSVNCKLCKAWNYIFINEGEVLQDIITINDCNFCGANLKIGKIEDNYTIVCAGLLNEFKKRVNLVIKEGYKPIGKITISHGQYWDKYTQAMIKEIKL